MSLGYLHITCNIGENEKANGLTRTSSNMLRISKHAAKSKNLTCMTYGFNKTVPHATFHA